MPVVSNGSLIPNHCNVKSCNNKLNLANNFLCKSCNTFYCLSHRFDFSHECKEEISDNDKWNKYTNNYKFFNKFSKILKKEKDCTHKN